jgi:hypothetical protein
MSILYTTKEAFKKAERYLKENQFLYEVEKDANGYKIILK